MYKSAYMKMMSNKLTQKTLTRSDSETHCSERKVRRDVNTNKVQYKRSRQGGMKERACRRSVTIEKHLFPKK